MTFFPTVNVRRMLMEPQMCHQLCEAACCSASGEVTSHYVLLLRLSPPTSPVSYSSSASCSCSSTTLAKLLALEEERERSCASGMDAALQHIAKLHTWVTLSAQTPVFSTCWMYLCSSTIKMLYFFSFTPFPSERLTNSSSSSHSTIVSTFKLGDISVLTCNVIFKLLWS